jgi:excinuclease UvrABC helicase subunit UvrB
LIFTFLYYANKLRNFVGHKNASQNAFSVVSDYQRGDQPQAIRKNNARNYRWRSIPNLLGVTGSGKTFTVANVIQEVQDNLV